MLKFYLHAFQFVNINYGCRNHFESYRHLHWKILTCMCVYVYAFGIQLHTTLPRYEKCAVYQKTAKYYISSIDLF